MSRHATSAVAEERVGATRPRAWGRRATPLVIAHRGASAERPENTLAAFRRARDLGADGIELDVMRCGTGELVVFHDDDLVRLCGRPDRVRQTSLARLREHDLGGGERIPTLDDVLAQLGEDELINVELKSEARAGLGQIHALRDDGLAAEAAACLARHRAFGRALVSSFDPILLARFRRCAPSVATGILCHEGQSRPLREAWAARLFGLSALHPEATLVNARSVARAHAAGRAVNVWTVDDPRVARFLAAVGADALITNHPDRIRAVLADGARDG